MRSTIPLCLCLLTAAAAPLFACGHPGEDACSTARDSIPKVESNGDGSITPTGKSSDRLKGERSSAFGETGPIIGGAIPAALNGSGGNGDTQDGKGTSAEQSTVPDSEKTHVAVENQHRSERGLKSIAAGFHDLTAAALDPKTQGIQSVSPSVKGMTLTPSQFAASHNSYDFAGAAKTDPTPDASVFWPRIGALMRSGDRGAAVAAARQALAGHPGDAQLQEFVHMTEPQQQTRVTEKTVKDRAKELMATLRGDAGDAPPPGAALASSPELASSLAFPALGMTAPPRALTPAALAALNRQDSGLHLADPLVQNAVSRIMVRDLPAAKTLLDRRLEQNPSDEPALRFRALTLRQMGKYEPSTHDAKAALTLAPWDMRARRLLIDDEVDLGHADQALTEANAALRDTPNSAEIYAARADAFAALGNRQAQLADLKQAAALDSQFDQLYQQALASPAARVSARPHSLTVWLGAVGTALIFFSFVLFRKRGDSSVRLAMRSDDHELLSRGARPDAAPAGFRIVRTLGQGGMGVVYEAVDLGLQRTVALKKLRSEIADSPRERSRFLREARTVAGLKHPNIVEIHSIHEDAEGLFLVFEKVNGETLHERLGRGALSPAEAVAYLRQVAKALDCAHSSGVVHQDLKPANVMVAGDTAKVMDFGIARRVQETMSTISRVEVAGTPAYMAPEQELGGVVGPAADIFALGACSYELLTGRTPFPSGGMMMKSQKMYRPASEVNPSLTAAADNAISRALDPEPAARWPSASSFVEALARSLS